MSDFKAKMHQMRFRLGLRPRPRWGSLQRSPRPRSWIKGPSYKGRGMGGEREGRKGKGRDGKRREGEGPFSNSWIRPWLRLPSPLHVSAIVSSSSSSSSSRLPPRRRRPLLSRDLLIFIAIYFSLQISFRTSALFMVPSTCRGGRRA